MQERAQASHLLTRFVSLEKEIRHAESIDEFGFIACNNIKKLLQYRQSIFWHKTPLGIKIQTISGTTTLNGDAPYIAWLRQAAAHLSKHIKTVTPFLEEDLPKGLRSEWNEWGMEHSLWCPFRNTKGEVTAGLWMINPSPWQEHEVTIMSEVVDVCRHAWSALLGENKNSVFDSLRQPEKRRIFAGVAAALLIILCIPVRQTVLAPAEVVALDPTVISSSLDGVIERFHIRPNELVHKGQLLFNLDPMLFKNRYEEAQNALNSAQEKYRKAYQHAFSNIESKSKLSLLQADVEKGLNELKFAQALLARVDVRAPADGIAIYSDPKDWLGKPIKVGQRVMLLADQSRKELDIELAANDAINLEPGSKIKLFLNVDPINSIAADLHYASYSASKTEDGILAYHLKGQFTGTKSLPRIGLKGTAKVYGERVSLFYYLFRRPMSYMRQTVGV